ncbi:MAG: hydrogenase maturation protease [Halobacteriales archaeon]|jgi:hydrogenase maturation protease
MTDGPTVAVVGVGNPIMGDDGVGPKIIERLEGSPAGAADDVRLTDAGTTGFLALEAMSGAERAVVVDAVETGESPGTIHEYRYVDGTFETDVPEMTMHDVSFTEAMVAGRDVYDLPDEIRVLGVEPADVSIGDELSEAVERAATELTEVLLERIGGTSTMSTATEHTGSEGDS